MEEMAVHGTAEMEVQETEDWAAEETEAAVSMAAMLAVWAWVAATWEMAAEALADEDPVALAEVATEVSVAQGMAAKATVARVRAAQGEEGPEAQAGEGKAEPEARAPEARAAAATEAAWEEAAWEEVALADLGEEFLAGEGSAAATWAEAEVKLLVGR